MSREHSATDVRLRGAQSAHSVIQERQGQTPIDWKRCVNQGLREFNPVCLRIAGDGEVLGAKAAECCGGELDLARSKPNSVDWRRKETTEQVSSLLQEGVGNVRLYRPNVGLDGVVRTREVSELGRGCLCGRVGKAQARGSLFVMACVSHPPSLLCLCQSVYTMKRRPSRYL